MKVARKKPESVRMPVYITPDQYEIWYSKPISLGKVDNRGGYWYTQDGMRFISSRDAMEYLIRVYELTHGGEPLPVAAAAERAAVEIQKAGATAAVPPVAQKSKTPVPKKRSKEEEQIAAFRRFLRKEQGKKESEI